MNLSHKPFAQTRPLARLIFTAGLALLSALPVLAHTNLLSGFSETVVTGGLSYPTAMCFAPDGRIFVTEQYGNVRVIKNGVLLNEPFVTLQTNGDRERGVIGITLDPNFESNHFVYVHYTTKSAPIHNRVSRFIAVGDVAAAGSEQILLELDNVVNAVHNSGALHFGLDGKLYIAAGDDYEGTNAQSLQTLKGKILRLNSDGSIPTDNPFYQTASGKNRAIWALGLRNPFTFDFQPGTGRMFINDVGNEAWEEINTGVAGGNFGWPNTEGATSDPAYRTPFFTYPHGSGNLAGCAVTGGTFYNPAQPQFPASYVGKYFFQDFCNNWIRVLDPATGQVTPFASLLPDQSLAITTGPDGSLYYFNRDPFPNGTTLFQIRYSANLPPQIANQPASQIALLGTTATFEVEAYGGTPLSYQWRKNGVNLSGANQPSYTTPATVAADDGALFSCVVTNGYGTITSNDAELTVTTNQPPTGEIVNPPDGTLYNAGDTIFFNGVGQDTEDGELGGSSFTWQVDFGHKSHFHPFLPAASGAKDGSFTIPTAGETATDVFYLISLTLRDTFGWEQTLLREIRPRISTLSVMTNPGGLQFTLDGQPTTAPVQIPSVVGLERSIGAIYPPQTVGGNTYEFLSWSDGGGATHTIATPPADKSYTLNYRVGEAVVWQSGTNTSSDGNTITKTTGGNSWNAGASSRNAILSGDGYAMMTVDRVGGSRAFGLSYGDSHQAYWDIDFSFIVQDRLRIYESGSFKFDAGPYAVGDVLKVAVEGGRIKYYRSDTLLYTSAVTSIKYPLVMDTSIYEVGTKIVNAALFGANLGRVIAPAITTSPASQTVGAGQTATFSVAASGDAPLLYQWQKDNTNIAGATGATYTTPATSGSDNGTQFRCLVSNNNGIATSGAATLTVTSTVAVTTVPAGLQILFDGVSRTAPYSAAPPVGSTHTLGVVSPQLLGQDVYEFQSWSDGGAQTHNVTIQDSGTNYIATFRRCPKVQWQNLVNVAATGSSLQKNAGGADWNAGAASTNAILSGDGAAVMFPKAGRWSRAFGLSNSDTHAGWWDIDYAMLLQDRLRIYEYGTFKFDAGSYAPGDQLKVTVESGVVKYYRNDLLLYTSSVPPKQYPLLLDTSLYDQGSSWIDNAALCGPNLGFAQAVAWQNITNATVVGSSLQKTGGGSGWNGGASSVQALMSGDGAATTVAVAGRSSRAFGLTQADGSPGWWDIDFAILIQDRLRIYEFGVFKADAGSYAAGDLLKVAVEGGVVKYYRNDTLLFTSTAGGLTYPLVLDTALLNSGSSWVDTAFLAGADLGRAETAVWQNLTNSTVAGPLLKKSGGGNSWNSGASSRNAILSGDGGVLMVPAAVGASRAFGLNKADANVGWWDIDFAFVVQDRLRIYEDGVFKFDAGSYAAGDALRVGIEGNQVKYSRNGLVLYTSTLAPSYPLLMDSSLYNASTSSIDYGAIYGRDLGRIQNVTWQNSAGVAAVGNSLQKTSGGSAWNAGASSVQALRSGDGSARIVPAAINKSRAFGLSNGDANQGWWDIDFAFVVQDRLRIYESGVFQADVGAYAPGDVLRVAVVGSMVRYYRNEVLLHTSNSAVINYPLLIDTSLFDASGCWIDNAALSGRDVQ